MEKTKKRIFEYDLMRVILSMMVLGIHILTKVKGLSKEYNTTWVVVNIFTNFFMISNPLFFILSGKFSLNKEFETSKDYKRFYKNKMITIIIPFIIASIIIYIVFNENKSIQNFIKKFVGGDIEGTYWFIYTLIGMMIFSPFLSKMIKNMNLTDKKIFLGLGTICSGFVVVMEMFRIKSAVAFTTFGIICWHFYYLLGRIYRRNIS